LHLEGMDAESSGEGKTPATARADSHDATAASKPSKPTPTPIGKSASGPTAKLAEQDFALPMEVSPASKAAASAAALLERPLPMGTAVSPAAKPEPATAESAASPFADIQGVGTNAATMRGGSNSRTIINLMGHVMGAVLGLVLGYYLLCLIKPDANVLELRLPGVKQVPMNDGPKNTSPAAP
jgi:hypothetical protein